MPTTDKRIDAYIAQAPDFAKPILTHLRKLLHEACPEVVETIKWSCPFFDYKGPLCNMVAFKAHCGFGFWKAALIPDPKGYLQDEGAGSLGKITSLKDLPPDKILIGFIKAAKKLNDENIKTPTPVKKEKKLVETPAYLIDALKKNKKASATFDAFSPSHRKEYVEWIVDAKTEATRERRMEQMMQLLEEGKSKNWKYHSK